MPDFSFATIVWIGLCILFFAVEAATVNLVSIWFAIGALAGLVLSTFNTSTFTQLVGFTVVSMLCLIVTRPLVKKYITPKRVATNSDLNIGKTACVICDIAPTTPGRVRLDGVDWTARSQYTLTKGTLCTVCAVESATLLVEPQTVPVQV